MQATPTLTIAQTARSPSATIRPPLRQWTNCQRIAFRLAFIFYILICIPSSNEWYGMVFHIDWTSLHYRDVYDIARFGSEINIYGDTLFGSYLLGYANWIIALLISIGGALLWTLIAHRSHTQRREYNTLYYWLRTIVRYRAAIGIIGFGFTKLLPVQMPYPGYGLLNTDFGDLTAQKIFWLSVGIVPWYQVFAGVVEILAGTLLFFRRTTALGAILLFATLGDIVYINFAYDGGVHVYSTFFVLLAGFLLVDTVPKIYNLLIRERLTQPTLFYPTFRPWLQYTRIGLKFLVFVLFFGVLSWLQYVNFRYDPCKQPAVAGVRTLRGVYNVSEFRLNHREIPYDPNDSVAWHEVEFEKWSSLTFTVHKAQPLDLSSGRGDLQRDVERNFEIAGVAGGRRVYHYYADTVDKVLYLEEKFKGTPLKSWDAWIPNEALAHIGNEVDRIDPRAASTRRNREYAAAKFEPRNRMILRYDAIDNGHRVILSGIDENKDSVYIVLDKVARNYALTESSLQAGNY